MYYMDGYIGLSHRIFKDLGFKGEFVKGNSGYR